MPMSKLELENLKESVIEQKTKLNSIITNLEHQALTNNFKFSHSEIQAAYVTLAHKLNDFILEIDLKRLEK